MAQAQVNFKASDDTDEIQIISSGEKEKRKVNLCLGRQRHISVFKNEQNETVVNFRKGTRSVTICKDFLSQIHELKETILLCCAFVEGEEYKDE